jgi:hypothetical protein
LILTQRQLAVPAQYAANTRVQELTSMNLAEVNAGR